MLATELDRCHRSRFTETLDQWTASEFPNI